MEKQYTLEDLQGLYAQNAWLNEHEAKWLLDYAEKLEQALDKLARLGNEPHYGNSIGNRIAQDALQARQPQDEPKYDLKETVARLRAITAANTPLTLEQRELINEIDDRLNGR